MFRRIVNSMIESEQLFFLDSQASGTVIEAETVPQGLSNLLIHPTVVLNTSSIP